KEALAKKSDYLTATLEQAQKQYSNAQNAINQVKSDLYLSDKISDELIIDSIATMNKIKDYANHIAELIEQKYQLQQELDAFYAHATEVTQIQFTYFNELSIFNDINQWSKEETNNLEKWNRNTAQIH